MCGAYVKVTWWNMSVEGRMEDEEGAVNSEERSNPKNADVKAAHSIIASLGA